MARDDRKIADLLLEVITEKETVEQVFDGVVDRVKDGRSDADVIDTALDLGKRLPVDELTINRLVKLSTLLQERKDFTHGLSAAAIAAQKAREGNLPGTFIDFIKVVAGTINLWWNENKTYKDRHRQLVTSRTRRTILGVIGSILGLLAGVAGSAAVFTTCDRLEGGGASSGQVQEIAAASPDDGVATSRSWIDIRAGSFIMGSPSGEAGHESNESEHRVTLTHDFMILSTEVTRADFESVMGRSSSGSPQLPVVNVSWHDAARYCNTLSESEGLELCFTCSGEGSGVTCQPSSDYSSPYLCPGYRLPTEAEWEFAARAGTRTATYAGDLDSGHLQCEQPNPVIDRIAWFCGNAGRSTHEVGTRASNGWGLHDMLGNVYEWVWDWYDSYPGGSVTDPSGPESGSNRVFRGGSWNDLARSCRAAGRSFVGPGDRLNFLGFRPSRSRP